LAPPGDDQRGHGGVQAGGGGDARAAQFIGIDHIDRDRGALKILRTALRGDDDVRQALRGGVGGGLLGGGALRRRGLRLLRLGRLG